MAAVQGVVQGAASGIPPGCCVCRAGEPVVFAALDHRLMAAKPPACNELFLATNAIDASNDGANLAPKTREILRVVEGLMYKQQIPARAGMTTVISGSMLTPLFRQTLALKDCIA